MVNPLCEEAKDTLAKRKMALAARTPKFIIDGSFEVLVALIGFASLMVIVFDVDDLSDIDGATHHWIVPLWIILMACSLWKIAAGIRSGVMLHITQGSCMVSWMTLALGLLLYVDSRASGLYVIAIGLSMVVISALRSCHYRAVGIALRKARQGRRRRKG